MWGSSSAWRSVRPRVWQTEGVGAPGGVPSLASTNDAITAELVLMIIFFLQTFSICLGSQG